jgi:hypothetical protein
MRREMMGRVRYGTKGAWQKYVYTGLRCRNVKEREYLNDLGVDGKTVLKRLLKN